MDRGELLAYFAALGKGLSDVVTVGDLCGLFDVALPSSPTAQADGAPFVAEDSHFPTDPSAPARAPLALV